MPAISSLPTFTKEFPHLQKRRKEISTHLNFFCKQNNISLPQMRSQLLRPMITFEVAKHLGLDETNQQLHCAALAVQTIHEASLFHDDILDNAPTRHHKSTPTNEQGLSSALMQGDLLIAKSFQLIAKTKCLKAIEFYSNCNQQVIEGELLQHSKAGKIISLETYEKIISLKTGSLFASAAATAIYIFLQHLNEEVPNVERLKATTPTKVTKIVNLANEIGLLYQMLDDFLDFLPEANTGKPPFQDFLQKKFTFVLSFLPDFTWENTPENILLALLEKNVTFKAESKFSQPMAEALNFFIEKKNNLIQKLLHAGFVNSILPSLLNFWENSAQLALQKTIVANSTD